MTRPMTGQIGAATLVCALAAVGCSRSESATSETIAPVASTAPATAAPATSAPTSAPATTAPATTAAPTTAPATTAAPTTAAPTTAAPTTTTTPPLTVGDMTLASNGVLPFTFGLPAPSVVADFTDLFGAPARDDAAVYPDDTGDSFLDAFGEIEYVFPVGRTVCWTGICLEFGGDTVDTMLFTGWRVSEGGVPGLTTAEGVTIGSVQADHLGAMTVFEGGCYSTGYGELDGIGLVVQSSGDPFTETQPDGTWLTRVPDPADVSVIAMDAGDLPIFLFADC